MRIFNKIILLTVKSIVCLLLLGITFVYGQSNAVASGPNTDLNLPITLKVGSPAPEIEYGTWVKGIPTSNFKEKGTYVVEFWATWCGPCVANMPHLSELAKKYQDKIVVLSFDVWETHGKPAPFETIQEKVKKFVAAKGNKMSYNVATDSKNEHMLKNWLNPAGIRGIPAAFIVRDKKVIWIGHPASMDTVLQEITNGTYDLGAYAKKINGNKANQVNVLKQKGQAKVLITALKNEKDWPRLVIVLDSLLNTSNYKSVEASELKTTKFVTMYSYLNKNEALAYLKTFWGNLGDNLFLTNKIENAITKTPYDATTKESYVFILEESKKLLVRPKSMFPRTFEYATYANICEKMNRLDEAIEYLEKGIDVAKEEIKTDRTGFLKPEMIDKMSKKIEKLRVEKNKIN